MRNTLFFATAFLLCTSCSNIPTKDDGVSDSTSSAKISFDTDILDTDKIIQNLVFAFTQIDNLHPYKTTLQMKAPAGELSKLVHTRFEDAGYGIQFVDSDQGLNYVKHSAQSSVSDDGDRTTYRISVGDVSVERDYMLSGEYTAPESVLRVSGSVEQDIDLNDDVFGEELADTQYSEVYFNEAYEPVIITVADRNITFKKLPLGVEDPAGALNGRNSFATSVMKNVRTNLQSNFSSIFAEYEDVQQTVLEFPNDSLRLGSENKSIIQKYADGLQPDTDVLSVVGCSHGRSKISNGNQLLAIGRANRVKEALMFTGLDHNLIYEEGCWDKDHYDVMPPRGVVLTHKRKI